MLYLDACSYLQYLGIITNMNYHHLVINILVTKLLSWENPLKSSVYVVILNLIMFLITVNNWRVAPLIGFSLVVLFVLSLASRKIMAFWNKDPFKVGFDDLVLTNTDIAANFDTFVILTEGLRLFLVHLLYTKGFVKLLATQVLLIIISFIGRFISGLYLIWIAIELAFIIPVVYNQYRQEIDALLILGNEKLELVTEKLYGKKQKAD
eukprot:TRINITY_DN1985_c0_g2_i2.p1 TRINITY_DN1985_c0_g2~~TRINITY_DN1985_c0_g2_i2.p1  ORF type:complete len:208 (+),score=13.16 TRINITY_DN1985_c0_g2_i2:234-857(+)